jgi:nicotinamide-nucleotide amidase
MQSIKELLLKHHQTLSVVESMTGGTIASKLVLTSGISEVFKGGLISYQNDIKTDVLGIEKTLIDTYGVVSKEVSKEMALKGNALFKSSICVSVTGYAEKDHKAYISVATIYETKTYTLEYNTLNRVQSIEFVSMKALEYLEKVLLSL